MQTENKHTSTTVTPDALIGIESLLNGARKERLGNLRNLAQDNLTRRRVKFVMPIEIEPFLRVPVESVEIVAHIVNNLCTKILEKEDVLSKGPSAPSFCGKKTLDNKGKFFVL